MLEFIVHDGGEYVGQFVPNRAGVNLAWNAISVAGCVLDDDHPILPLIDLNADPRLTVLFREQSVMEGPIETLEGSGPGGTVKLTALDDFEALRYVLGWPKPSAAVAAQDVAYWRMTGPLESVVKAAIAENAARLGLPWTIAPDLGRGPNVSLELRFHPLSDRILPLLRTHRMGLHVKRNGSIWEVDVSEGETFPTPLTPESGLISSYKWSRQRATASRIVTGGAGQEEEREFGLVIDEALEAAQGPREAFDDSRMSEPGADLAPYGRDALQERAAGGSITAELNEGDALRFGVTYDRGTVLPIDIGLFHTTDVVSEVEITIAPGAGAGGGLTILPKVGLIKSTTEQRTLALIDRLLVASRDAEKG